MGTPVLNGGVALPPSPVCGLGEEDDSLDGP